ncbi:Flp pilus assembly protein CpaB [Rubellimicrobium roseum]|uniref:Flp pilus assembly protein CpaB n=1 Tax=Rubellimicrobium roseum TaxID=687525 RepID=A0A5C4NFN8_9RHOB|nr:Flp pilus assembly protein CpaB [Rubellimicrobium roseum]TNC70940.1 Flp pilus assembly protein CpaB [Rubellimicrobium roseum]
MKNVFGLVLVAGLGLAGTAVYMVRGQFETQAVMLSQYEQALQAATPTVEVYAVNRRISYGESITPSDVQLIRYAEPFLPEGVFRTEEELFPEGPDVPRVALRPMELNEPLLVVKVTEPGGDVGITQRLTPGLRAFAIGVDATSGVSGFLRPGDRVDVYWTGTVEEGGQEARQVTQLIESGLRLVAIDQSTDDTAMDIDIASNVTVEVTPQQVANLAQAQASGSLSLSLVGQTDDTVASAIEVDQKALLGLEDAPAPAPAPVVMAPEPPPPPPRICTVRTRKGAEVFETPVDCPAG